MYLWKHFNADQIHVIPSRKSLKKGALPTLNLPWPSVNATSNRYTSAIEIQLKDSVTMDI